MTEAIIIAAIAAMPPTLVALLALRKGDKNQAAIQDVHLMVNDRLTQLLAASVAAARAEGRESMSSTPDPVKKEEQR